MAKSLASCGVPDPARCGLRVPPAFVAQRRAGATAAAADANPATGEVCPLAGTVVRQWCRQRLDGACPVAET